LSGQSLPGILLPPLAHEAWNSELIPPIFESPRLAAKKAKKAAKAKAAAR